MTQKSVMLSTPDNSATTYYRVKIPYQFLPITDEFSYELVQEFLPEHLNRCDLAVLHRVTHQHAGMLPHLKEINIPYIYDTDDLEFRLPKDHHLRELYAINAIGASAVNLIQRANAVTVTTPSLRKEIFAHNRHVYIVPNAIDYSLPHWNLPMQTDPDWITIGFIGGVSHLPDLKFMREALYRICDEYPNVRFYFCGMPKSHTRLDMKWNAKKKQYETKTRPMEPEEKYDYILKQILSKLPFADEKRVSLLPALELEEYGVFYTYMDIVIAPLAENTFNHAKSELKILEAGSYGTPIVGGASQTYNDFNMRFPKSFYYASTADEFYTGLKFFIDNPSAREDYGQRLASVVREHYDIQEFARQRMEIYKYVLSQAGDKVVPKQKLDTKEEIGRNAPCPCASGLKYKKCHGS